MNRITSISLAISLLIPAAATAQQKSPWAIPAPGSCDPEGGLRGGPLSQEVPPLPFITGEVLEHERLESLQSYLPPEIWRLRDMLFSEGMTLEVGPCFRDYSPPGFFQEATDAFAGQVRLGSEGGLEGYSAGLPFPPAQLRPDDSRVGLKWAWNIQQRYQAGGFRGSFRIADLVSNVGQGTPVEGEIFKVHLQHRADRPADEYRVPDAGDRLWASGGRYLEPFDSREIAWLQFRDTQSLTDPGRSDDLYLYWPSARKVRRLPAHLIEGVFTPPVVVNVSYREGTPQADPKSKLPAQIEPQRSGFEGLEIRPLLYTYAVLGVQDVLSPINARRGAYPTDPHRSFGCCGLSWADDRWELRRALILEATRRQVEESSGLAKLRLWADLQTLQPLFYASYDAQGELIDVGHYVGRWSEDRPDYPRWPDDPDRPVRVIDPVGASFTNVRLRGSWRRESWDMVSVPESDQKVRRSISLQSLQRRR